MSSRHASDLCISAACGQKMVYSLFLHHFPPYSSSKYSLFICKLKFLRVGKSTADSEAGSPTPFCDSQEADTLCTQSLFDQL